MPSLTSHHAPFVKPVTGGKPEQAPDAELLRGYLGPCPAKGHTRLYFDPTLQSFVDLDDKGVAHVEPDPDSKLGAVFVWVQKTAAVQVPTSHAGAAADREGTDALAFLTGRVHERHMNRAAVPGGLLGLIATLGCNATTPSMPVREAMPERCNATTPNGAFRGDPRLMTLLCQGTTPNGMFRGGSRRITAMCNATTPNGMVRPADRYGFGGGFR